MRAIDADALLKRVQDEEIQAQAHGREFSTCFMSPGGTPSTEWWYVEDLIENAPTIEPEIVRCKDCEYGKQDEVGRWFCWGLGCQIGDEDGSGYCANAERRADD